MSTHILHGLSGNIVKYMERCRWNTLSGVGYYWLDWLAYNVRRSLGIECCDEEERRLGIREAQKTLRRIRYYASIREEVIDWLVRVVLH